jgi:hypothetical protein
MKRPRPEPPGCSLAKYIVSSRSDVTIVDVCSWRGLGKASEEKLVFFVAQATTRVLHGKDDIDLFFSC